MAFAVIVLLAVGAVVAILIGSSGANRRLSSSGSIPDSAPVRYRANTKAGGERPC